MNKKEDIQSFPLQTRKFLEGLLRKEHKLRECLASQVRFPYLRDLFFSFSKILEILRALLISTPGVVCCLSTTSRFVEEGKKSKILSSLWRSFQNVSKNKAKKKRERIRWNSEKI